VPLNPGRYSCRIIVQNAATGRGARGSASLVVPKAAAAPLWLDPPLLLKEETGSGEIGAAPESTLSALFGYDPAKYAPWAGSLPAGPRRVYAAVRCALAAPETELEFTASDSTGGVDTDVPVTVVDTRPAKNLKTCLVELPFAGLAPGVHTLTVRTRDKSGLLAGESKVSFTVK
jgi:hypothetical protein